MREIINFNVKWAFTKNATEVPATMPEKWDWVTLPHSWNAIDGQDGGADYYRGTAYYAKELKKFPACLDDMAQIIGPTAKVAPSGSVVDVIKTLKGRNACLIKNAGVIATGRTLDEAHTGSLVLEKGAIAYVGSTVLGNSVKISTFDAVLMRFIYKTKYSKKDQSAKQAELKA